jgi:hypothetical protein
MKQPPEIHHEESINIKPAAAASHQLTPCSVTSVPLSATNFALLMRRGAGGVPTGEASADRV